MIRRGGRGRPQDTVVASFVSDLRVSVFVLARMESLLPLEGVGGDSSGVFLRVLPCVPLSVRVPVPFAVLPRSVFGTGHFRYPHGCQYRFRYWCGM